MGVARLSLHVVVARCMPFCSLFGPMCEVQPYQWLVVLVAVLMSLCASRWAIVAGACLHS